MPHVEIRSLTQPAPFQFETDKRGEMYQLQLQEKQDKNALEEIQKKVFIANPLPENTPWVPDLSEKKIVIPEDIVLNTDIRSAKRQEFDHLLKMREMQENIAKENQMKIQMVKACRILTFRKLNTKL